MNAALAAAAFRQMAVPLIPWQQVDVVDRLTADLNMYGKAARRAFLDEFGCPPVELPQDRLYDAVTFVDMMAPF